MLCVSTSGNVFERGRHQGETCAELARPWFERTLADLAGRFDCDSVAGVIDVLDGKVSRFRCQTERVYPQAIEECCGIASGMGFDHRTYFTAVMAWRMSCTTFGFRNSRGRAMLAKTDDIGAAERGMNVLEIVKPDEEYRRVEFHFAGTIWTVAGINECGLAMAMTGIPGPVIDGDGCCSLFALHEILPGCATVAEALELIEGQSINHYGYSAMLADASGGLMLVEKNGAGTVCVGPQWGDVFAHTNHILDPALRRKSPEQVEPTRSNGMRRLDRAKTLASELQRSFGGLRTLLSDGAIWQTGQDGLFTDFGVFFEPDSRRVVYWTTCPDAADGETVDLSNVWL